MGFIEEMEEYKADLAKQGLTLPEAIQRLLAAAYRIREEQEKNSGALFAECVTAKDMGHFLADCLKRQGFADHRFTESRVHSQPTMTRAGRALLDAVSILANNGAATTRKEY